MSAARITEIHIEGSDPAQSLLRANVLAAVPSLAYLVDRLAALVPDLTT